MAKLKNIILGLVLVLFSAVFLAACASATNPSSTGSNQIQVNLSEFKIESSQATFAKGVPYRLSVTNKGKVSHEFMIVPPTGGHSSMSMEEMDKSALLMVDEHDLPTGASQTVEFTFPASTPPGKYEFACYVPGHYEAGMRLAVEIK